MSATKSANATLAMTSSTADRVPPEAAGVPADAVARAEVVRTLLGAVRPVAVVDDAVAVVRVAAVRVAAVRVAVV